MLVGRDEERAALAGLLARARAGQGGSLVVRGEPEVGKSALLTEFVEGRGDARLLRTGGVESESPLAFAALHRMLLPILSGVSPRSRRRRGYRGRRGGCATLPTLRRGTSDRVRVSARTPA